MVRQKRLLTEMNVVPYIDVMLVLLIVFMVSTPFLVQGIPIELPRANAQNVQTALDVGPLLLTVDSAGAFYLNIGDEQERPIDEDTRVRLLRGSRCSKRGAVPGC